MSRYLFEATRKHLMVKLCLGVILSVALGTGAELAYLHGDQQTRADAAIERQVRRMSHVLSAAVAKPLAEGNRGALQAALAALAESEKFSGARVLDTNGVDLAEAGNTFFNPDETIIDCRGVDYEDARGNSLPVGAVVIALSRRGAETPSPQESYAIVMTSAMLVLLVLAAIALIVRGIRRPVDDIVEALHKLARGKVDIQLAGIARLDEIGRVSVAVQSVRDAMHQRQRDEEEMRTSLAEKTELLDRAPVGILAERDGIIVACNHCLEQVFGYSAGELVGRQCASLYASPIAYARANDEVRRARQQSVPYFGEAELRRKDGKIFWGAIAAGSASAIDSPSCVAWIYSDITHAKVAEADGLQHRLRLEKLVAERTRQLEEARQVATRVGIALNAPALQRPCETSLSVDTDGESPSFDPASMLEGVAALLAPSAGEKGLELVLDIDPGLPSALLGDPLRIAQVLTDLLSNGIRYTKQGEVVVMVREAGRDGQKIRLHFCVRDQGIGMTPERQASLFNAADQRRPELAPGHGMGLAISKRLVELMGGRLEIESKVDRGSTFHFTAEFEIAERGDRGGAYAEHLQALAGCRVMVIDDNRSARLASAVLLSKLGFVPALFESGWSALASLERAGAPKYQLICIDSKMPEIDGLEVARRLRAHYGSACPPLLLLTASGQAGELQGIVKGIVTVVSKPLTIERLFNNVVAVLGVPVAAPVDGQPPPRLKGKRVLLLCDGRSQRNIMADFLRGAGLAVRVASNGIDVLQAVREEMPDCILVAASRMRLADAYEATGRLRALGYSTLPIIALSPSGASADRAGSLAAGMDDFVAEPVALPMLLGILAKWMAPQMPGAGASDREALPPLPPELDVESGLRHLRGKTALFLKALRMFRDSCGQQFQHEFRSAVRAGDWQTSERLAHGLKGTAATIGANQVSAAAARLEAAIRAANYAEANTLLAELTEKLQILVEGLARIG